MAPSNNCAAQSRRSKRIYRKDVQIEHQKQWSAAQQRMHFGRKSEKASSQIKQLELRADTSSQMMTSKQSRHQGHFERKAAV